MKSKYLPYFNAVANKSPLNAMALLQLSYQITQGNPKLLKINNFFATKPKTSKFFHKYNTPFDGIYSGMELIKNHPEFNKQRIGTLKANEILQLKKLQGLLNLSTS